MKYFSVKRSIKIGGKLYRPCVCYPLPDSLLFTVKSLVDSGVAAVHDEEVYFQSGKMIDSERLARRNAEKSEVKITRKKSHKELKDDLAKMEAAMNTVEAAVGGEAEGQ